MQYRHERISGQRLLDHMIDALAGHLPTNVRTVRTRVGVAGGLQIWPVPSTVAADAQYGFWDDVDLGETGGRIEQRGNWLPWGFGAWVPLPRRVRMRVEAIAALESVQEAVRMLDERWPAPDAEVKARVQGDEVVVWFYSPAADSVPPPVRVPRAAFD